MIDENKLLKLLHDWERYGTNCYSPKCVVLNLIQMIERGDFNEIH